MRGADCDLKTWPCETKSFHIFKILQHFYIVHMRCTHTANCVVLNEFEAGGIQFAVLWGMSDVSPGRICKFNSAAGANVQSCGDYFPPSPPPALGKFANLIPPFPTSVYLKNLTMVFKDFHKSTLTNHISGAIDKKERRPN